MPALWENETEIGRRLMQAWEGEGSVFIVTRSFEIYQELKKLNDASMCRWLSPSCPRVGDEDGSEDGERGDDGDAESISTVHTDPTAPDIGAICLRTPQFTYEKPKAGLPTCFLFGRDAVRRKIDVCLGRRTKSRLSRVHFALGLKNDTWAIRHLCEDVTLVNGDTKLVPGTPSYALWPGRVNTIRVADIELELYYRDSRDATTYWTDHRDLPLTRPQEDTNTESSGTSLTTTTVGSGPIPNIPLPLTDRFYILEEHTLSSRTAVKKFLAIHAWAFTHHVLKDYSRSQLGSLNKRLRLLDPLPVSGSRAILLLSFPVASFHLL
jgi:hypothetical protein